MTFDITVRRALNSNLEKNKGGGGLDAPPSLFQSKEDNPFKSDGLILTSAI